MSHKPKWSFHKDRGECKKSNCQTGGSNPVLYSTEQKNITAVRSVTLYVLLNKSFAYVFSYFSNLQDIELNIFDSILSFFAEFAFK